MNLLAVDTSGPVAGVAVLRGGEVGEKEPKASWFLTLLGVAIPPVAGIMVVDYFILKRSRATLDASRAKGELPEKVEKWNPIAIVCWIAGFAVGEITSIMNVGIPGLNSLILAGVLYWIVMKVYASMKKVDTVTFTETDQVL